MKEKINQYGDEIFFKEIEHQAINTNSFSLNANCYCECICVGGPVGSDTLNIGGDLAKVYTPIIP